jgi:hypothetical protein
MNPFFPRVVLLKAMEPRRVDFQSGRESGMTDNGLYNGDSLDILQEHIVCEWVGYTATRRSTRAAITPCCSTTT